MTLGAAAFSAGQRPTADGSKANDRVVFVAGEASRWHKTEFLQRKIPTQTAYKLRLLRMDVSSSPSPYPTSTDSTRKNSAREIPEY